MSQKGSRKMVTWVIVSAVILYAVVAISPIPRSVGRVNPSIAALLSPPSFNFGAYYEDGQVLGFTLGESKLEAVKVLSSKYLDEVEFHNGCGTGVRRKPYFLSFDNADQLWSWGEKEPVWCFSGTKSDMYVDLYFEGDYLKKVRVTKTNNEAF